MVLQRGPTLIVHDAPSLQYGDRRVCVDTVLLGEEHRGVLSENGVNRGVEVNGSRVVLGVGSALLAGVIRLQVVQRFAN